MTSELGSNANMLWKVIKFMIPSMMKVMDFQSNAVVKTSLNSNHNSLKCKIVVLHSVFACIDSKNLRF